MNKTPDPVSSQASNRGWRRWADLGPRVRSAMFLLPVTVAALVLGHFWFALLIGIAFAGGYREWEMMITGAPLRVVGFILVGMLALVALAFAAGGMYAALAMLLVAVLAGLILGGERRWWRAGGMLYAGLVICAVLALRGQTNTGIFATLFVAIAVWGTDSAAFFTGRQVGGMKLSPDISPSKTWSGALGGLLIGSFAALVFWLITSPSEWWIGLLLAASISIVGQIGDLAESALKRFFRIKDSGDIIPGHGGLMDRLDSLTFAILLAFAVSASHVSSTPAEGLLYW